MSEWKRGSLAGNWQILDAYGSSCPYGYVRLVTFRFDSVTITKSSFLMVARRNTLNRPVLTDKVVMATVPSSRQLRSIMIW